MTATTDETPDRWFVYGPKDDGSYHVHGPSHADETFAATLGVHLGGLEYVGSFDHEPSEKELP